MTTDSRKNILVGIDPGLTTAIATWDRINLRFYGISSGTIIQAMNIIDAQRYEIEVWFEDARLRQWFGNAGREKLQGAGSIKRDCSIWETFLKDREIPYRAVSPRHVKTKLNATAFKSITGVTQRLNQHERDSAILIFKG